jgi:hypothetical protein
MMLSFIGHPETANQEAGFGLHPLVLRKTYFYYSALVFRFVSPYIATQQISMKKIVAFSILALCLIYAGKSSAQKRVPIEIIIDTSFGQQGKQEVNIGGFNDEVMAYIFVRTTQVGTLCGKVGTSTPGKYHLGMIRVDSSGNLDKSFGTGGIVNSSWGESDYANSIDRYLDTSGTLVLAGASGTNPFPLPSVYKFKKNGTPDSTFGTAGRVTIPFDEHSYGEAVHVDISFGQYKVSGKSIAGEDSGVTGFGVMTLNPDGTLDTTFGVKGRMVIPALVHSVQGFFLNDRRFFFCGISDGIKKELLIGRFTENGVPDSSVGVNGLIHTGIILTGDTLIARFSPADTKIVMLLPAPSSSPTHLTIRRCNSHGVPDSLYDKDGVSDNDILPSFQPKGLFVGNDFSQVVSGMTNSGIGNSIFVRINDTTARPDPFFNHNGIISVDVGGGIYSNYLKFVEPAGNVDSARTIKRFIGVGGSNQNDVGHFMITRLIGLPYSGVREDQAPNGNTIAIYPDPVSSNFKIEASSLVKNIRIVDALGREVMQLGSENNSDALNTFSGNASNIPNGMYYCVSQTGAKQIVKRFIVSR